MNRVRSANKFLQANTWSAKAYLTNDKYKDKGQLFGIMAFIVGLSGKPTLMFASGTHIEYKDLSIEDSRIVLSGCTLYYNMGKTAIKEVEVRPSMYRNDDEDYYHNLMEYSKDNQGYKTLDEYVMQYSLSKENLARLNDLLIGDAESTLFLDDSPENLFIKV